MRVGKVSSAKRAAFKNVSKSFTQATAAQRGVIGRSPATRGAQTRGFELKALDVPAQAAGADWLLRPLSTTMTIDMLNGIQEGSSFFNRIGRRIHMKSVHVTGHIVESGQTPTNVGEYLRILLIYDRQPNGNFPNATDILQDTGNDGTNFNTSFSKMNLNNVERFAILRDKRIAVPQNSLGTAASNTLMIAGGSTQNEINWFVPLKDLETHYKSSTNPAGIGDIATGALFLVCVGNIAAASCAYMLQYNSRLRFTDV